VQLVLELFQVLYFMIGFFVQSGGIGPSFGQAGGVGELPLLVVI